MIDLTLVHEQPEQFKSLIKKKDPSFPSDLFIELEKKVRILTKQVEELRHQKNELAKQGKMGVTHDLREKSIEIGKTLKEQEHLLITTQEEFKKLYLRCPNIPLPEIPEGGKEGNSVVKEVGKKPEFTFEIKHHVELGTKLGWFDFQAAALMSGNNFALYKGQGVKLIYALVMFMLKHNESHGFSFVLPPYLVNEKSLEIAGNFPKFYDDVYAVTHDNLFLIPTSEVSLANLYRDTIFSASELPIRLTAPTSCFRREAGGYGAAERGLIRIHQFEKVELYTYCVPEESNNELTKMVDCAQELLQKFNLHYRISLLAAQDCSFPSAKTYDIEVWLPGQNRYMEVSSCSNCTDFQSRRGGMRYKKDAMNKTTLVHTLNSSSLALPRLIAAIMETFQQPDGSIKIPDVLNPWFL